VRHAQMRGKANNGALKQIQSQMPPELFAFREQQMHSKADPQRWCSRLHLIDECLRQSQLILVPHAIAERANTRQDELRCGPNIIRIRSYEHIVPQPPQRVLKTSEIVQFVINDCDHSTPFVDGISACSTRVAR